MTATSVTSSPSSSPPPETSFLAPHSLLQAIAAATTNGSWGDARFVVRCTGSRYAVLRADLSVLRANGAEFLVDQIIQSNYRSEEEAINIRSSPKSSQHATITSRPSTVATPPNPGIFYFPVTGISYVTMRAILMFLQTGHISFAPLRSTISDNDPEDDVDEASVDGCMHALDRQQLEAHEPAAALALVSSPKSVYRAARKFRLTTLCQLASRAIDEQITPANCLKELFGSFTLRHPDVFEARFDYVYAHWNEIDAREKGNLLSLVMNSREQAKAQEAFAQIMSQTRIG